MKIGLLSAANSIHTVKIANGLTELGHQVVLFSLKNHEDAHNSFDSRVKIEYLKYHGGKGYLLNQFDLKKRISKNQIDVLNAHYASGYGTLASLINFHPYVLSVWGSDIYSFPQKSMIHKWIIKRNLSKADILLSTSNMMAKQTNIYAPGRKIVITPFGVDVEKFKPADMSPSKDGVTIGIVKLISKIYGIKELIMAFHRVTEDLPGKNIKLHICGDGDQRVEMEKLSNEMGLRDIVTFFGKIPNADVPEALNAMDIFCAPSLKESFGVAVVEAMACGLPCVTSDAEGFQEVMSDGITGFVVPRGDIEALANKLKVLINDKALRAKMGESSRERVLEYYNWQENLKTIEEVLLSIGEK